MSNIKVVDVNNNEEDKQEQVIEQIEEVKEETKNEVVEEPAIEQESKAEQVEEQPKQETKPMKAQNAKPCVKTQDKLVRCPKCSREMKLKSFRYGHQQKCNGGIENTPVKPFSKPRATPKPKTQPIVKEVYEEEVEEEQPKPKQLSQSESSLGQSPKPKLTQEVKNQVLKPQPSNLVDFASHYQLLQNQFIQQKKEKYNSLCQNMFAPKSKKR